MGDLRWQNNSQLITKEIFFFKMPIKEKGSNLNFEAVYRAAQRETWIISEIYLHIFRKNGWWGNATKDLEITSCTLLHVSDVCLFLNLLPKNFSPAMVRSGLWRNWKFSIPSMQTEKLLCMKQPNQATRTVFNFYLNKTLMLIAWKEQTGKLNLNSFTLVRFCFASYI